MQSKQNKSGSDTNRRFTLFFLRKEQEMLLQEAFSHCQLHVDVGEYRVETDNPEIQDYMQEVVDPVQYAPAWKHVSELMLDDLSANTYNVAVVESCTGGMLARQITAVPGSSKHFWGSVVAYTEEAKAVLLDIPVAILQEGTISPACTHALQTALLKKSAAACAMAITGVAGPDDVMGYAPGTVFMLITSPKYSVGYQCSINGDRERVQYTAAQFACFVLHELLCESPVRSERHCASMSACPIIF